MDERTDLQRAMDPGDVEGQVTEIARLRAECVRLEDHINDADDESTRLRADNAEMLATLKACLGPYRGVDDAARVMHAVRAIVARAAHRG